MAKIDRLGWAAGVSIRVFGARIGIRVTDPGILHELQDRLPIGWRPSRSAVVDHLVSVVVGGDTSRAGVRRYHLAYAEAVRVLRTLSREELLGGLQSRLEQTVVEAAPGRLFVHAGAVGWRGRALLVPGASHSGKTTLVAALLRAGATYYSDEYAVLDSQGRVHPYPRPLQIRRDGEAALRLSAEDLDSRTGRRPLPVGLVLVSMYRAGTRWRPLRLTPGRAVLALLAHAPAARLRPESALALLEPVARRATVLHGVRGEAEETVAWLLRRADEDLALERTA